jgi:hypothetical protein
MALSRRWQTATTSLPLFFSILFVAALLIAFNGGIAIGSSNHVGLIPVVRRLLDPNYLPGDFNIELRLYHHRVFAWMLAVASLLFGEERGIIVIHLFCLILLSAALYYLCRTIGLSLSAYLLIGTLLAVNAGWTGFGLEENTFVGNREIQPPPLAHAFVLIGTALIIRKKWRWAAFCAGLTTLVHLQIGFIFTLIIAPFYALKLREFGIKEIIRLAIFFLIPLAPALWHFSHMLGRGVTKPLTLEDLNFRMPHHFVLASTAAALWSGGHLIAMGLIYFWLRRGRYAEARGIGVLLTMSALLAALALIHFADYYYFHWVTTLKPQFPRLSSLITVYGAISIVTGIEVWCRERELFGLRRAVYLALFLVAGGYGYQHVKEGPERFSIGVDRYAEGRSSWHDMSRWIKANGPRESIYLAPPARYGFTYLTDRSSVVEFKINPDGGQALDQWYERLRDLCGGQLPDGGGLDVRRPVDRAYGALTAEQITALAQKYGASFAILPHSSPAVFPVIYENKDYRLVSLG